MCPSVDGLCWSWNSWRAAQWIRFIADQMEGSCLSTHSRRWPQWPSVCLWTSFFFKTTLGVIYVDSFAWELFFFLKPTARRFKECVFYVFSKCHELKAVCIAWGYTAVIFASHSYMQIHKVKQLDVRQMQTTKAHCPNYLSWWSVKDEFRHPTVRKDCSFFHWKQQHLFF